MLAALLCAVVLLGLGGCSRQLEPVRLDGPTMGTTWQVTYLDPKAVLSAEDAHKGVTDVLERVNASMSTYREDSEISAFNRAAPEVEFAASADFAKVFKAALSIGEQSGGAFDVTVAPLVDLWGFGPAGIVVEPPPQVEIDATMAVIGQQALTVNDATGTVSKQAQRAVDFSALAKGYAVDEVAAWLRQQGIDRYLVEVGGEMHVGGLSPRDTPWRIAVEEPSAMARVVAAAILLTDVGTATSGDYRNYFEVDGKRYSHTIDPRTGYPVSHDLVSVTVVHDSTMVADAWATALSVLGAEQGRVVALEQGLAVYFIQRTGNGFVHSHTPAFEPYLDKAKEEG